MYKSSNFSTSSQGAYVFDTTKYRDGALKLVNVKGDVMRNRECGQEDTLEWEANKMPHENSGSITVHTISNLGLKWEVKKD